MIHLKYFVYVVRHKWFVFRACLRLGVPLWRAVIHDWSKFTPSEWLPYAQNFFWTKEQKNDETWREMGLVGNIAEAIPYGNLIADRFKIAVNHHYNHNPHHWEYWLVREKGIEPYPLPMPETYVREMVADWVGAGMAITGNPNPSEWYEKNKKRIILRGNARLLAEKLIKEL